MIGGGGGLSEAYARDHSHRHAYGIFKDIKNQFSKDAPTNVMFINLGATSYSVSVTEFVLGKLSIRSSHYNPYLGGRNINTLTAEVLASKFGEK